MLSSKVVIISPSLPSYVKYYVGTPRRKLAMIPNGIDTNGLATVEPASFPGIPDSAVIVGMIARMSPPKDYATFINACHLIHKDHAAIHFVAVGDGRSRESLQATAKSLGLDGRLHFLGARTDVPSIIRRLTVAVLSSYNEGMPMSLLEAMAAGCPTVGSDVPSIRWLLDGGKAGVLFRVGDPQSLADAINRLLESEDNRRSFMQQATCRVQEFSLEKIVTKYTALYEMCSSAAMS